jgi:hypothetical protein
MNSNTIQKTNYAHETWKGNEQSVRRRKEQSLLLPKAACLSEEVYAAEIINSHHRTADRETLQRHAVHAVIRIAACKLTARTYEDILCLEYDSRNWLQNYCGL